MGFLKFIIATYDGLIAKKLTVHKINHILTIHRHLYTKIKRRNFTQYFVIAIRKQ